MNNFKRAIGVALFKADIVIFGITLFLLFASAVFNFHINVARIVITVLFEAAIFVYSVKLYNTDED